MLATMSWSQADFWGVFVISLFWFLGRAASGRREGFWAYKTAIETAQPEILKELTELREDVRLLAAQVEDARPVANGGVIRR